MKFGLLFFIYNFVIKIYVFFLSLLKVKKNRILLHQPFKYGYDCNPKYIAEEILRRNKNYQLIWATRVNMAKNGDFPAKIRLVTNKFILLYYFSTSVCCISNSYLGLSNYNLKKKKGQTFINTWHGSLGIKRIGETEENRLYNKKMLDWVDIFISNSDFESEVYRKSLLFEKTIYELGHPRNDVFFVDSYYNPDRPKIKVAVENFLNRKIDNKKLILYAPTFREIDRTDCFNLDYNLLLDVLKKKYNEDFLLALKFHPRTKINLKNVLGNNIVDLTRYPDMQGLMVYSDIMISDYSSCIFDYMLSKKPAFIYASDIEKYNNERGFFYPLETTPFPIITNNNELSEKILGFDYNIYKKNVEEFLKEKGCIDDGRSSERVVDLIETSLWGEYEI